MLYTAGISQIKYGGLLLFEHLINLDSSLLYSLGMYEAGFQFKLHQIISAIIYLTFFPTYAIFSPRDSDYTHSPLKEEIGYDRDL